MYSFKYPPGLSLDYNYLRWVMQAISQKGGFMRKMIHSSHSEILVKSKKSGNLFIFPSAADRVARWFIFKPKPQFWSNLEGLGKENVVIFYDHLEYFTAIWYNYGLFVQFVVIWYIFPFWYVWTKKNLATLLHTSHSGLQSENNCFYIPRNAHFEKKQMSRHSNVGKIYFQANFELKKTFFSRRTLNDSTDERVRKNE
jgi:hypothetical protein